MEKGEIIAISAKGDTSITQEKKCLIFKKTLKGKQVSHKRVLKITKQQIKNYKLLGAAEGLNLFHCIYLASRYNEHFNERVVAYQIVKPTKKKFACAIVFYEKNKKNS